MIFLYKFLLINIYYMVSLRSISARSLWSHAGTLARLFATLALAPPVDQSTANSIENAYDNKCLRHLGLRLDVACRSLHSLRSHNSLCSLRSHISLCSLRSHNSLCSLLLAQLALLVRSLARPGWTRGIWCRSAPI